MQSTKIESKISAKLQFLLVNFEKIVELERTMKFVLSQAEIKKARNKKQITVREDERNCINDGYWV